MIQAVSREMNEILLWASQVTFKINITLILSLSWHCDKWQKHFACRTIVFLWNVLLLFNIKKFEIKKADYLIAVIFFIE